ncbi:MAG: Serine dehydrogenase proteinase [candidate division NC10 bacterium]|nr:Serine dehydrogenase proteinase [candidate division NC10 bacterium]
MSNLSNLLWVLFLIAAFAPYFQQKMLVLARLRLLRKLERTRGSRVITLIHRQESRSFLGIPILRYIDIDDSEQLLRAIRLTQKDLPIDLILHTPGGLVLAAEQIAHAIKAHPAKVTVFIPHYAMSGGTLVALAADEIVMDENAVLGPIDPQLGEYPAASILKVIEIKDKDEIEDKTLILADVARKAITQITAFVQDILRDKMEPERMATRSCMSRSKSGACRSGPTCPKRSTP